MYSPPKAAAVQLRQQHSLPLVLSGLLSSTMLPHPPLPFPHELEG